jgi:DNA integrity scanning protein DisA with diadenylate cyclase activity
MEDKIYKDFKKLEETLIQVGLRIAKRGEGALFVVGEVKYTPMVNQSIPPFKAIENPKLLESLALMDGAVIINKKGFVSAYGVKIKSSKIFKNFGTRHAAGLGASIGDNLVVIVSEEDKKIKILRRGKMIMQIDALQRNVEQNVSYAVRILETVGAGTIGTIGTSLLIPALGITFFPGIIIFGSAYYLGKIIKEKFEK